MGKKRSRWRLGLLIVYMLMAVCMLPLSLTVRAQEPQGEADNPVYDRLKSRIETAWDDGMKQIEETDPIEISGNLVERLLRGIAAGLYRNLRSIKAGALLAGGISSLFGVVLALLARKDKKMRKMAVGVCVCTIPAVLLVFVFGISWYVSFFR